MDVVETRPAAADRRAVRGTVRIAATTEVAGEAAEVAVDRDRVEVARVSVGRVVVDAPSARSGGGTTVIPVVAERPAVVRQPVLTEVLHVRHVVGREAVRGRCRSGASAPLWGMARGWREVVGLGRRAEG